MLIVREVRKLLVGVVLDPAELRVVARRERAPDRAAQPRDIAGDGPTGLGLPCDLVRERVCAELVPYQLAEGPVDYRVAHLTSFQFAIEREISSPVPESCTSASPMLRSSIETPASASTTSPT